MPQTISICVMLLGLLLASIPGAQALQICEGKPCRATKGQQPLNLMKFMRGGAGPKATSSEPAHARTSAVRHRSNAAKTARSNAARTDAARTVEVALPRPRAETTGAAAADNSHDAADQVEVVDEDRLNALDRAADDRTPAEPAAEDQTKAQSVQLVKARDFNHIDRLANDADKAPPRAESPAPPAKNPDPDSWTGRVWSALERGFVALSGLVQRLFA